MRDAVSSGSEILYLGRTDLDKQPRRNAWQVRRSGNEDGESASHRRAQSRGGRGFAAIVHRKSGHHSRHNINLQSQVDRAAVQDSLMQIS